MNKSQQNWTISTLDNYKTDNNLPMVKKLALMFS